MSDAFSPDVGQTIAPDGSVTYDFAGRIRAVGVDLAASQAPNPPSGPNKVRWLDSTGAEIASLYGHQPENAVIAASGSAARTLVDELGEGSFLRFPLGAAPIRADCISYGETHFAWNGTGEVLITVAHKLEVFQATVVLACSSNNNSLAVYRCFPQNNGTFICDVVSVDPLGPPAAGTGDDFQWIAIG